MVNWLRSKIRGPLIQMLKNKVSQLKCVALLSVFWAGSIAYAQNNYVAFELQRENNWDSLITEDVNGDGANDLVFSSYTEGIGRELHIHHQQADGTFASSPKRIEIKTEIIAVGFADLRPAPGKELLLLSSNGIFSLSTAIQGYTGNIRQLLEWDLIAAIPDLQQLQFFNGVADLNGDGNVDLLLPGDKQYGYFAGLGDERFELVSLFTTVNENLRAAQRGSQESELTAQLSINPDKGVVIQLSASAPSPFRNFIEAWDESSTEQSSLLRSEHWMPTAVLAELNQDELLDIVYLNVADDGLGQLNIHYQSIESGFASTPDWTGSLETSGDLQLVDMDNDGLLDLLRLSGDINERDARFYVNRDGEFDLHQPAQVMRFSGYDLRLDFINAESTNEPVLNVSYYTIPVVDAIRNASINRIQLLYGSDQAETGQLFNRRPDARLEESFSAANVRGLSEQMSLHYDVDGDGNRDALYITDNGTLAAKKIDAELRIADEPFWEYVSPRTVFEFEVIELNNDGNPDLLLRHGTTTTVLVAAP